MRLAEVRRREVSNLKLKLPKLRSRRVRTLQRARERQCVASELRSHWIPPHRNLFSRRLGDEFAALFIEQVCLRKARDAMTAAIFRRCS